MYVSHSKIAIIATIIKLNNLSLMHWKDELNNEILCLCAFVGVHVYVCMERDPQ
jgi:hypothetical protein